MLRRLLTLFSLAALGSLAAPVYAQDQQPDYGAPAHVAFVDGTVTLEREGRTETSALNMPLLSGDRLRTAEGRVEVLFDDGSALHLDERTTIDVQSDDLLRLIDGRIRLNLSGPSRQVDYRIDSAAGSVRITQAGEYRIAMLNGERETQLELAVLRGAGEIFTDQGSTRVRAGERAYASEGLAPSHPYVFNSANWDDFDRWSETRRDVRRGASSQYLPASIQTYGPVFDQYGDWRYAQPYGYVWYPRVAVGWRPYYYGRWISYPRYGWTWVGLDLFSWPTHHYGRWGFSAGSWFWIPGHRWAPAYVSWAYAPGYVSWCPLGFNNRPIIAINLNFGSRYYSPWNAWTVVRASHFGGVFVHQRAVLVDRVDQRHRPVFVSRPAAPAFRDVAIPRGSAPIRWAGARSLPPSGGSQETARPRDNYFTRGGDRGEHIVAPAVPSASRTAPEGPVRRIEPRGGDNAVSAPRERIGREPRQPYSAPSAPVNQEPRLSAPSYDRRPMRREPVPGMVAPAPSRAERPMRPVDRGELAVPRGMPAQPREGGYQRPSYGGQGAPSRVASLPQSAPAPAPRRSAPAERSRPSGSQSTGQATSRRGGGRGGN